MFGLWVGESMSGVEPFSEALVDKVVAALDVDDNGSHWVELKHMEANGFDLAWQQPSIRGSLVGRYDSPFFERGEALPHAAERQLVLQLRDRLRRELSLPVLSDEESRDWSYNRLEWKTHSFIGSHEEYKHAQRLSDDEIAKVVKHIKRNAPNVIDYIGSVVRHNAHLAESDRPDDKEFIWAAWVSDYISDQVCRVLRPSVSLRTSEGEITIREQLWEEAS